MSEMVDRVMRDAGLTEVQARAAIAAMRVPSYKMVFAGVREVFAQSHNAEWGGNVINIFGVMIDAALGKEPKE